MSRQSAVSGLRSGRRGGLLVGLCGVLAASLLPAVLLGGGSVRAAARPPALAKLLLSAPDLPQGWKGGNTKGTVTARIGCASGLEGLGKGWHHSEAVFADGKGLPFVSEGLAAGPSVASTWGRLHAALATCRSATVTINGKRDRATISPLPFTVPAKAAVASLWHLTAAGLPLGIDVVSFRVNQVLGTLSYTDVGTPDVGNAEAFVTAAISKAGGAPGRVKGTVSIATATVHVARTREGDVGYRIVGSGPPLLLVMGYSGTMDTWDPQFVDALAHRFTVVVFDNAGIGRTSPLPSPLTIDAMAQQTSALIASLHLGAPPDVLGWSMGGMIAEALAVLHPTQVDGLVLCSTFPGTGAQRPAQSAVDALNAGGERATSVLFPPGHQAAATVFGLAVSEYRSSASAPTKVVAAQAKALLQAWADRDEALQHFRQIVAPTLIADGTLDRLVPPENPRHLAAGIAGARLLLYKGAGHAFLFQKLSVFVPALESFLKG
ncbi:MAG: alpha/beta fold hydrolase [Candidatus Dormibacteria bacterium]